MVSCAVVLASEVLVTPLGWRQCWNIWMPSPSMWPTPAGCRRRLGVVSRGVCLKGTTTTTTTNPKQKIFGEDQFFDLGRVANLPYFESPDQIGSNKRRTSLVSDLPNVGVLATSYDLPGRMLCALHPFVQIQGIVSRTLGVANWKSPDVSIFVLQQWSPQSHVACIRSSDVWQEPVNLPEFKVRPSISCGKSYDTRCILGALKQVLFVDEIHLDVSCMPPLLWIAWRNCHLCKVDQIGDRKKAPLWRSRLKQG